MDRRFRDSGMLEQRRYDTLSQKLDVIFKPA
jgi:hypothetical protein